MKNSYIIKKLYNKIIILLNEKNSIFQRIIKKIYKSENKINN